MRYLIEHRTRLEYASPVREHQCELRVAPRTNGQTVLELELVAEPAAELRSYVDAFGNTVYWFGVVEPHDSLTTTMRSRVETSLANPFDYETIAIDRESAWLEEAMWREPRLRDYVYHRSASTPELTKMHFGEPFPKRREAISVLANVQEAVAWVKQHFRYQAGATDVHAPLSEVLEAGAGVCQDFAHLLVAIVRSWGVPARYAAGYIDPQNAPARDEDDDDAEDKDARNARSEDKPSEDKPSEDKQSEDKEAENEEHAPAEATHAWADVLIPGAGWRGFDATNGLVVNDTYIAAAVGRDSTDAAPQRGSYKGDDPGTPPDVTVRVVRED